MTQEITTEKKIEAVLRWAESEPDFDDSFVVSLQDYCEKHECITQRQATALNNIIDRWDIPWEDYLEE